MCTRSEPVRSARPPRLGRRGRARRGLPRHGPGNQPGRLSELGRREDALAAIEEALTIYRQLAATRLQIYAAPLADSLRVRAAILASLGRDSEAAKIEAEAAQLERPTL